MAKTSLRAVGYGSPGGPVFSADLLGKFRALDTWIHGAFALEQGFIFTAMILSATTVAIIERRFERAALWCGIAAALSLVGLMHSYRFTPGDTTLVLHPAWPWAAGYAILAALFLLGRWITVETDSHQG